MKKNILILSMLISQISFSQTTPDFRLSSVGYFCGQDAEAVYKKLLTRLQTNANNICKNSSAILVTKIDVQTDYCTIKLTARYTCDSDRSTYRPNALLVERYLTE